MFDTAVPVVRRSTISMHDGKMVAEASDSQLRGLPPQVQVASREGKPVVFTCLMTAENRDNEVEYGLYAALFTGLPSLIIFND